MTDRTPDGKFTKWMKKGILGDMLAPNERFELKRCIAFVDFVGMMAYQFAPIFMHHHHALELNETLIIENYAFILVLLGVDTFQGIRNKKVEIESN